MRLQRSEQKGRQRFVTVNSVSAAQEGQLTRRGLPEPLTDTAP